METAATICKLCGQEKPLCRSHIVPDCVYGPIKNDKNQIYSLGRKTKTIQTGYYERLLCADCESILSAYESKFKIMWMDAITSCSTRFTQWTAQVPISDFDSYKLFHLSVFWKAAVSNGFRAPGITLGPYEPHIARMLINRDPGNIGDFPLIGYFKLNKNNQPEPTITSLIKGEGRFENCHHHYLMSYAYCDWILVVARPGSDWLIDLERQYKRRKTVELPTVQHDQSKSFTAAAECLRNITSS